MSGRQWCHTPCAEGALVYHKCSPGLWPLPFPLTHGDALAANSFNLAFIFFLRKGFISRRITMLLITPRFKDEENLQSHESEMDCA